MIDGAKDEHIMMLQVTCCINLNYINPHCPHVSSHPFPHPAATSAVSVTDTSITISATLDKPRSSVYCLIMPHPSAVPTTLNVFNQVGAQVGLVQLCAAHPPRLNNPLICPYMDFHLHSPLLDHMPPLPHQIHLMHVIYNAVGSTWILH